jgi:hypothetical protein
VSSAVKFEWSNQEDEKKGKTQNTKETALPSALYELLSVLHLLGILALQEANNCLTAKATADGYLPRVTEGKFYFFSIVNPLLATTIIVRFSSLTSFLCSLGMNLAQHYHAWDLN